MIAALQFLLQDRFVISSLRTMEDLEEAKKIVPDLAKALESKYIKKI